MNADGAGPRILNAMPMVNPSVDTVLVCMAPYAVA